MVGREQFDLAGLLGSLPMAAPARLRPPPPPPPESLSMLTSLEDVRTATRRAASSAQRLISIYTADLEPEVYDQPAFLEIVKRFVLSRSFAKVRVLLHEPLHLIGNSNRFVAMARRLTSYIEIRVVAPAYQGRPSAMLIADDKAIVYRTRAASWDGVAGFNQPPVARLHRQEFDEMWVASEPDDELRVARR